MSGAWSPCSRQNHDQMNSSLRILSFAVVLMLTVTFRGGAQEIESASVSKDTILIGDQVEWVSRIKVPRGMRVSVDSMAGYVVPGVEIIGAFTVDTVDRRGDMSTVETRALITSFDSGSYVLPPLVVYFEGKDGFADTMRLPEVPLEVMTVPVDTASFELYDIRPQFRYPVTFGEVFPWALLLMAVAAIVFFAVRVLVRRRRSRPVFGRPDPKEPPHITALRELDRIRSEKLWKNGKEKQYYTELTDALRAYIEQRFDIRTIERTSNEILTDLSGKDVVPADFEVLKELFGTSDLVKFAKYSPSEAECENAVPEAVRFVNDTCRQEQEEEKKNE